MTPPRRIGTTVLGILTAAFLVLSFTPASASVTLGVVKVAPAGFTPHAIDSTGVNSDVVVFAQVGDVMYAGGVFRSVQNAGRTQTFARTNIFAFHARNGAVLGFAPNVNGQVWAIVPQSDGSLILGGSFTTVNGVARRGLAKVSSTGVLVPGFAAPAVNGAVTDAQMVSGRLIVSGSFGARLLALNPATGANLGFINLGISGTVASNAGLTRVYRFAVNPQGNRLIGIGNFTSVGGQPRRQAFMINLDGAAATVNSWYDPNLDKQCAAASSLPVYLRDVDWSPDGSTFGIASTGYIPRPGDLYKSLCDAAVLYDVGRTSPRWFNYTGGDTLHSIAVTGAVVYVGGHQRWLDNPLGVNDAGPGAVSRPGIGAIDAATGRALAWNPGKERGVGAKALYATPAGLWVGSDTRLFNGKIHDSIAFCPA